MEKWRQHLRDDLSTFLQKYTTLRNTIIFLFFHHHFLYLKIKIISLRPQKKVSIIK